VSYPAIWPRNFSGQVRWGENMAMTVEFYTTGGGELAREFFNTVVIALGGSGFASLMKLALFAGISWVMVQYMITRNIMAYVKWFALYYLMLHIVFLPKVSVQIIDRLSPANIYRVDHVPLGLGMLASITSRIGYGLTELIEDHFHLPDYLPYNQTGLLFGSQMMIEGNKMRITDPKFANNLKGFVRQCIFYDVLLNKYSLSDLAQAQDMWGMVASQASPARAFSYDGEIVTCANGAKMLTDEWNRMLPLAQNKYSRMLFPNQSSPQSLLLQYLPMGYQFLIGLSQSASETMQQTMMAHLIEDSILDYGARVNAQAALEQYAYLRGQSQTRMAYQNIGKMSAYWLPIMKIVFELLLIGSFIIIFPLSLLPIGFSVIKNYAYSLLYIELWGPLFAIINLVFSFYAQKYSQGVAPEGILTLSNINALSQVNQDISTLAGYISYSVIFLAGFLVKGLSNALHSMAYYVGGMIQSSAGSAAGEAVTGNIQMGNTSFNNASAFHSQAYHLDQNAQVMRGAATMQMSGGSLMSQFADGSTSMNMNPSMSQLATSINFSQSIRSAAQTQADYNEQSSYSQLAEAGSQTSTALRTLDELNQFQSQSEGSSQGSSLTDTASESQSITQTSQLVERFANEEGISQHESEQALSTGYWSLQFGGGIDLAKIPVVGGFLSGLGGHAGVNTHKGHKEETISQSSTGQQQLLQHAMNFIQDHQFSETLNQARQASAEHRFNTGNEQGQRLAESFSAQMDEAQQYGEKAASQYSSALSYRELASSSDEQASQINSNVNQDFYQWLQQQPAMDETGFMTPTQIDTMMKLQPLTAQTYAKQYEALRTESFIADYAREKGIIRPQVKEAMGSKSLDLDFGNTKKHFRDQGSIQQVYQNFSTTVKDRANIPPVDSSAKAQSQPFRNAISEQIAEHERHNQPQTDLKNKVENKLRDKGKAPEG